MLENSTQGQDFHSIGVIMLGLMGDVIMRTPILRELRKAFPRARIICIVDPIGKEVLELGDLVDDFILTNRKAKGVRYLAEKLQLQAKVIGSRFDLLIDLYGGASSRRLVKMSFAKNWLMVRGFNIESNLPWQGKYAVPPTKNSLHLVNGAFEILRFLDYPNKSTDNTPQLRVAARGVQEMSWRAPRAKPSYYVITLGSGDPRKFIDCELVARLAEWLFSKHGLTPRVVQNPGQEGLQEELLEHLRELKVPNVKLDVLALKELRNELLSAHFLISPDTGLFHFGIALNVPVLGVFSYTNPQLVTPDRGCVEFCFKEDPDIAVKVNELAVGTKKLGLHNLIVSCDLLLRKIKSVG